MKFRKTIIIATALVMMSCVNYFARQVDAATPQKAKAEHVYLTAPRDDAGAAAAFVAMTAVLHHPRCMNCHTAGDFPRQGDDGHPHAQNVRRGATGNGVTSQRCSTCHQDHNLAGANMPPGAPDWQLPPSGNPMIWSGLSDHQLCEIIKDPAKNGRRDVDHIVEHMTTPALVLWGWHPGDGRTPIPMSQADFAAKVKEWAAKGAACP
jgi:cytochrome c5